MATRHSLRRAVALRRQIARRRPVSSYCPLWFSLCIGIPLACTPAASVSPAQSPSGPNGGVPEATLRGTPPEAASPAAGTVEVPPVTASSAAPTPPAAGPLECVQPADPEFDKESTWSKEMGQRLNRALPTLRRCAPALPAGEEARVTLRMVYEHDGAPASQHVVQSTPNGCAVTECLKQGLARVLSPPLLIEEASYDIALVLTPGAAPERADEAPDVLPPDEAVAKAPNNCVDPAVARLSMGKVREVVATSYDELEKCYGEALTRDHAAAGNVTFEFVIGHEGEVSSAQARSATLQDCTAIRCMLDQFRGLAFPQPVGRSVRVIYPIQYVVEQAPVSLR